jgi:hypothetical protein
MAEPLGWWTISGAALLQALRDAANGQDPDHENIPPRDEP